MKNANILYIKMDWHESHEIVLVELSEEAQINAYLHKKAYEHFSGKNIRYQLPIIILSVFSGSANFVSSSFTEYQQYIVLGVGGISILTSIISSVSQFLKLGEFAEGHRIAYNSWEKYYARISIQLKLKRENRDNANDFTLTAQSEYLRLKEMSPDVPLAIANYVRRRNKEALKRIHAPVVISGFRPVRPFPVEPAATRVEIEKPKAVINMGPTSIDELIMFSDSSNKSESITDSTVSSSSADITEDLFDPLNSRSHTRNNSTAV